MQKPFDIDLPADLPEDWSLGDTVAPDGTEVGLTEKHGYNYQSKQINDTQKAVNIINEAFENVSESLDSFEEDTAISDSDTVPFVQTMSSSKKKISFSNLITAIRTKLATVFAALSHTHGNITNDGKIGSTANQVVITDTNGVVRAGTAPVAGGGTGASTAAGARSNLGITPANIGAAPTSHNHDASNINAGTLSVDRLPTIPVSKGGTGSTTSAAAREALGITPGNIGAAPASHNHDASAITSGTLSVDRLPTHNHNASNINAGTLSADRLPVVPVSKGGTGVSDLNVNKLRRDTASDSLWQVYLSPSGNDNNTGLAESTPMKSIRAAVGRYGGLNRLQLWLLPGTYTDSATVVISGSQHVTISGTSTTAGAVVVTHPIIFQSTDAKLQHVTFDLSTSSETYPGVTLRQAKYDIQNCVFKGKTTVHAGINVSLGSSGYIVSCVFQSGIRAVEIGSGAFMTALTCSIATGFEIGFNVNGGMLLSGGNTNNAATKFTMYNSAAIFNDGVLLNTVASAVTV